MAVNYTIPDDKAKVVIDLPNEDHFSVISVLSSEYYEQLKLTRLKRDELLRLMFADDADH